MILPRKFKAAAGPAPDPSGDDDDDSESQTELESISSVTDVRLHFSTSFLSTKLSKYRDPLHVLLDYIAEVDISLCELISL